MVTESAKRAIIDHLMIPEGEPVLVAVSGGVDSVVLLDVLHQLSGKMSFDIVVGHVDHGLRGSASDQDAAFVRELASDYDLPSVQHCLTDLNRHRKHGREGAARQARLAALESMAVRVGATRIALGHTVDDQAETVLYNMTRGAGAAGARGIPPVRVPFIRPLIRVSRRNMLAYARERGLNWREDATNSDLTFARNRIRHRVLPELRRINPRIVEAISRNAGLLADLDDAAAYFANERMSWLCIESEEPVFNMCRSKLVTLPDPVLRLMLREAIRRARGGLTGIEFTHIEAIRRLITGRHAHGRLSLPGLHIRMQNDVVTLSLNDGEPVPSWDMPVELGETRLPHSDWILELQVVPVTAVDMDSIRSDRWTEAADADRVTFPLRLRTRQPGDRFTPLGLGQPIKLKDFLINQHTPFFDRGSIPLLCDNQGIIWVVGMRLSDIVKLSDRTQRVLLMRMKGVG